MNISRVHDEYSSRQSNRPHVVTQVMKQFLCNTCHRVPLRALRLQWPVAVQTVRKQTSDMFRSCINVAWSWTEANTQQSWLLNSQVFGANSTKTCRKVSRLSLVPPADRVCRDTSAEMSMTTIYCDTPREWRACVPGMRWHCSIQPPSYRHSKSLPGWQRHFESDITTPNNNSCRGFLFYGCSNVIGLCLSLFYCSLNSLTSPPVKPWGMPLTDDDETAVACVTAHSYQDVCGGFLSY